MTHMVDNNEPLSAPVEPLKPIRNSKFYMDCITLQVENELFKIPLRCISFNTEPFRTLASRSLPSGDSPVEGESDEDPIVLPDTSKVDFERLLEVICDLDLKRQKIKSKHVWISALKLSTKWRLLDVRRMAIEVLSEMKFTPGQFIQYGRDYKVAQWLVQGYHGFARQESPLGPLESQEVTYGLSAAEGLDCILKLAALRENGLTRTPRPSSTPSGKSSAAQPSEVTVKTITVKMETIRAVFKHEVDELSTFEKGIDRPVSLTLDEWLAFLKLSSLREMDSIRNDAITNLPALLMNPAQKLGVAIDYNIEFWLVPAMQELVQREAPLSVADLEYIGIECAPRLRVS
ncbi:BTB domain-containing protein [Pleurotus pulmonarius]